MSETAARASVVFFIGSSLFDARVASAGVGFQGAPPFTQGNRVKEWVTKL